MNPEREHMPLADMPRYSLSEHEALEILDTRRPIPAHFGPIFGEENLQELWGLIQSDVIRDLDMMLLTGEVAPPEAVQYMAVLPEHDSIRLTIKGIAEQMIAALKPKLPYYLGKTLNADGTLKSTAETKGIVQIMHSIDDIYMSLDIIGYNTNRNARLHELCRSHLISLFVAAIGVAVEDKFGGTDLYWTAYNSVRCIYQWYQSSLDPSGERRFYEDTLRQRAYASTQSGNGNANFAALIIEGTEAPSQQDLEETFDRIKEAVNYKKILPFQIEQNGKSIEIHNDEHPDSEHWRTQTIALITAGSGKQAIYLIVDRSNGEIYISGTTYTLGDFLPNNDCYLRLKARIYDAILEYLNQKEDDIEVTPSTSPLTIERSVVRETTASAINTDTAQGPLYYIPEDIEAPEEKIDSDEEPSTVFNLRNIANTPGARVLATLKKLLGDPVRIRGSHHIFRGRNGTTYPISIHGNKPVGIGLLRKSLRHLGILPMEFHQAL